MQKKWNPAEYLEKAKKYYQAELNKDPNNKDRIKRMYLAHKLLLSHPKITEEMYRKHITPVALDLYNKGTIENGKLKLNREDVTSDFLKNHLSELAKAKGLYHKVENIHRSALYDNTPEVQAKYSSKDHANLLEKIKEYYKSKNLPMKQRVSEIIKQAKSDPTHPLATAVNGHEVFNDLVHILKAGKSQTSSKKSGISFRNKFLPK